ncbi:MAG: ABC transporter permease subunit [Alphaproteobacteria bacterium]|nr:ABC transporter permease subunit [Alphaproteobacteria bacterium]
MRGEASSRIRAILVKEFIQLRRDRITFAMMVGIPIMQLILFGFAINTDPKHLPTGMIVPEPSAYTRSITAAMRNSEYFELRHGSMSERQAREALKRGTLSFVVSFPPGFSRDLVRGQEPQLLIEADATDPAAASNAVAAFDQIVESGLRDDLNGPLAQARQPAPPVDVVVHRLYNPEGVTRYNIVPGLLGVILTMTMTLMTAISLTREVERGTMENLLAMPVKPLEVMIGKITPYIGIGFVQVAIILLAAHFVFGVPMIGSFVALFVGLTLFIATNLALGYTFSTVARSQMQAMQMTFFFFLPSILLSGFMFPFRGMPEWAQWLGEVLPLTHFLRLVRGTLLKGSGMNDILPNLLPIVLIFGLVSVIALFRYRRTLD